MPDSPLYVGYLPLPPQHARFLRVFIPVSLWMLVVLNIAILIAMRDPSAATWNTNDTVTLSGRIRDDGAPVLITEAGETVLIVRDSKLGAFRGPAREGPAEISGFILERSGRRMIEITQAESDRLAARPVRERIDRAFPHTSPVTIRGEILDAKCFLGAMKPGDGKTHKACATVCIRGGIPAAMRIRRADGTETLALIVGPDFAPFPASVEPFIADPIEIDGAMFRIGDMDAIAVDPDSVRRISR